MRSTYRKLGPYIRELKVRNHAVACTDLRGVRISKEFMTSVANVHGTDLSKYKRVERNQFAFNPMHVGRDEVLPIALLSEDKPVIVSPAYVVFEVRDHEELLPEYLMMWCRRPEFDRNAWFTTDNSVRGGFSWNNFCEMELPIPSIEKQREIVKEYQTVVDRILLNDRLKQKLEEAAQAIYKQWFVDFEFPMTAEYAESIGKPELAGLPYKSNGGEMKYNEVLDQEIPNEWSGKHLRDLTVEKGYIRGPFGSALLKEDMRASGVPVYEQQHAIYGHRSFRYFVDREKADNLKRFRVKKGDCIISCSGTLGEVSIIREADVKGIINQALLILRPDEQLVGSVSLKAHLTSSHGRRSLVTSSGGSAQVNMAKRETIEDIPFVLPESEERGRVSRMLNAFDALRYTLRQEIESVERLRGILLARIAVA